MSEYKFTRAARFYTRAVAFTLIATFPLFGMGAQRISLTVNGQVQPLIANSSGAALGVTPGTGVLAQDLMNATLSLRSDNSRISIENSTPDVYAVTLHGSYEENLSITLLYVDTDLELFEEITFFALFHGDPIDFSFTIDPQAQQALLLTPPVVPVTELSVEDYNGLGRLTWSTPIDPSVVSYKVYAKSPQDALFTLLSDVTTPYYDTGHPVRTDESGDEWDYVVTSIAEDGSESFFNNALENRLWIRAFFDADQRVGMAPLNVQFTDESIGNPTSWQWDFNGDNVVDSTEKNPWYTFTDAGKYSISLTISGSLGTDENTQNSYITVIVDTDGDGLDDAYEITLGLNPNLVDTDGDGLVDGQDGIVSIINYPGGIDLDLDGFVDGEQDLGTDPAVSNLGDLAPRSNLDNIINLGDLLVLTRLTTGAIQPTPLEMILGDINGDTQLNAADILLLLRAVLNGTAP